MGGSLPSWCGERSTKHAHGMDGRSSGVRAHRHGQQERWESSKVRVEKVEMEGGLDKRWSGCPRVYPGRPRTCPMGSDDHKVAFPINFSSV